MICRNIWLSCYSDNNIGHAGWEAVMKGLENCTRLEQINDVACQGLISGALMELQLSGHKAEEGFAVSFVRYLPRSASTLASLDIRCGLPYPNTQAVSRDEWLLSKAGSLTVTNSSVPAVTTASDLKVGTW